MEQKIAFGIRLKQLRKERGLTQEQLAELTDRTPHAISAIERGINAPNFETMIALAKALRTEIRELFLVEDGKDISPKRGLLLSQARSELNKLSDTELGIAVAQLRALSGR